MTQDDHGVKIMGCSKLVLEEPVLLDGGPLDEMRQVLGPDRAARVVDGAMEELAVWISRLESLQRRGDLVELSRLAQRIVKMAGRMGMPLLAKVAADLHGLCHGTDQGALRAVLSRTTRVGEASLAAAWGLKDLRP